MSFVKVDTVMKSVRDTRFPVNINLHYCLHGELRQFVDCVRLPYKKIFVISKLFRKRCTKLNVAVVTLPYPYWEKVLL